jgi:hypothetical protein
MPTRFLDWWRELPARFLAWWRDLFRRWLRALAALLRPPGGSPIAGMPLRYLIGANSPYPGEVGAVTMVSLLSAAAESGTSAGYCNAFDESPAYDPATNTGHFGPYRRRTPTAIRYGEGIPDQEGDGYRRNICGQLDVRARQGIRIVEIDNPDAYPVYSVLAAITWAEERGLSCLAKNPGLSNVWHEDVLPVIEHPNVVGIVVERGAGDALSMHALRTDASKPALPVRFVAYRDGQGGERWAEHVASQITANGFRDMGVTMCDAARQYASSRDVLLPTL